MTEQRMEISVGKVYVEKTTGERYKVVMLSFPHGALYMTPWVIFQFESGQPDFNQAQHLPIEDFREQFVKG